MLRNELQIRDPFILVEEGKYYPMMKIVRGEKELSDLVNGFDGDLDGQYCQTEKGKISESELSRLFDEYGEHLLKEKHPVLLQFLEKEKAFSIIRQKRSSPDNEKTLFFIVSQIL